MLKIKSTSTRKAMKPMKYTLYQEAELDMSCLDSIIKFTDYMIKGVTLVTWTLESLL